MLTMIFCWLTTAHAADKRALLLGGAGDPAGRATSFDTTLPPVARALARGRYERAVAFDGGHESTEWLLDEQFKSRDSFTPEVARAKLDDLERDILAGKVSQAMVVVNSHGRRDRPAGAVHLVEANGGTFDVADLKRVQAAARAKGVKLAILDQSCYSGQTLALASPETCVITAGSAETVAYVDYTRTLFEEFRPGDSLEAAFLRARRKLPGAAWPQIGTAAGLHARDTLARLHDEASATPDDFAARDQGASGARLCLDSVTRQFDLLRHVTRAGARIDERTLGELARRNQEYQDLRTARAAEAVASNATFTLPSGFRVSHQTLLTLDESLRRANLMAYGGARSELGEIVRHGRELRTFRAELMERLPKFRDEVKAYNERRLNSPGPVAPADQDVQAAGDRLAETERRAYQALYAARAAKDKGANPCRDFKF